MPKYSREMEAKIIAAFEQGKRNSVISRELRCDRGALASRRKAWEKREQEEEKPETEPKEPLEPEKYTRAPTNHRAPPSNITELEKRINELEELQRGSNPSLLEKRISTLEEDQRVDMRIINSSITDFRKMREELLESVESKLRGDKGCKHIGKNGFCHHWHYSYDEVEKREYLQLRGRAVYEGKIVYLVNVKEHPFICSACPSYEPKS